MIHAETRPTHNLRRFVRQAATGRLVGYPVAYASILAAARVLPPAQLGVFVLGFSLSGLGTIVGMGGTREAPYRLLARVGFDNFTDVTRSLHLRAAGFAVPAALGTAIALLKWPVHGGGASVSLAAAAIPAGALVAVRSIQSVAAESLRAVGEVRVAAMFGVDPSEGGVVYLVFLIAIASLWIVSGIARSGISGATLLWLLLFAHVVTTAVAESILVRYANSPRLHTLASVPYLDSETRAKSELRPFKYLFTHDVSAYAMGNLDLWFLGLIAGPAQFGAYGVLSRIAAGCLAPGLILRAASVPLVASDVLCTGGLSARLARSFRRATAGATVVAVAFGLGLVALLKVGIPLLPPHVTVLAFAVLPLLFAGGVMTTAAGPTSLVLIAGQRERDVAVAIFTVLACGAAIGWILVQHFGAVGAATLSCLMYSAQSVWLARRTRRVFGLSVGVFG